MNVLGTRTQPKISTLCEFRIEVKNQQEQQQQQHITYNVHHKQQQL